MANDLSFDVTDKEYLDTIALEVRGDLDEETSNELRSVDNIQDFHRGLIALKRSVETQLSNKKSRTVKESFKLKNENASQEEIDLLYKDYSDWRAKAVRFLGAIELEISEIGAQVRYLNERENYIDDLISLISEQMTELDGDYSDIDEKIFDTAMKIKNMA